MSDNDLNEWMADAFEDAWFDAMMGIVSSSPEPTEPDPDLCPCRCGGSAKAVIGNDGHGGSMGAEPDHAYVQCQGCGMRTKAVYESNVPRFKMKATAAALWNRVMKEDAK